MRHGKEFFKLANSKVDSEVGDLFGYWWRIFDFIVFDFNKIILISYTLKPVINYGTVL